MSEVIHITPAERDQDHIEMIVYNDPKVPDRNYPERRRDQGPLPRLLRNAQRLEEAGADILVIASNTTHRYHDDIARSVNIPVPNVISLVRDHVTSLGFGKVGILTTETAVDIGLFDTTFEGSGVDIAYPDEMDRVMKSIYAYKRGEKDESKRLMDSFVDELAARNVDAIILGCTEFSALPMERNIETVDAASVLANYCVDVCRAR